MKASVLSIEGKKLREIDLPSCFSGKIREEIVAKVLEAKKRKQPYSPSPIAGNQYSASGKIKHRRHVWKTHYGRGVARLPRKIMSKRGSQFIWVGATVPQAVGGRRAHPPKIASMINDKKINKKEMKIAMISALSATASSKEIKQRYGNLKNSEVKNAPLVVEGKLASLKTRELVSSLRKILGDELFEVGMKKRKIRSGKGKMRGRRYKSTAGVLLVTGKDEKIKTSAVEVKNSSNLNVTDLAKGDLGRLTVYTESAVKNLGERLK